MKRDAGLTIAVILPVRLLIPKRFLVHLLQETGLRLSRPLLKGAWSGHYAEPKDGQVLAIIALASTL